MHPDFNNCYENTELFIKRNAYECIHPLSLAYPAAASIHPFNHWFHNLNLSIVRMKSPEPLSLLSLFVLHSTIA